jgi:hypothetical protein
MMDFLREMLLKCNEINVMKPSSYNRGKKLRDANSFSHGTLWIKALQKRCILQIKQLMIALNRYVRITRVCGLFCL